MATSDIIDYKFGDTLTIGEIAKLKSIVTGWIFGDNMFEKCTKYAKASIGLFGLPCVGKSAFLNSTISLINNKAIIRADTSAEGASSKTQTFTTIDITSNIKLSDIKGAVDTTNKVYDTYSKAYRGKLVDGGKVVFQENDFVDVLLSDSYNEKRIQCPVIVTTIGTKEVPIRDVGNIKNFVSFFNGLTKGIDPVIVCTGRDKLDTNLFEYRSQLSRDFSVSEDRIFIVQCMVNDFDFEKILISDVENRKMYFAFLTKCFQVVDYIWFSQMTGRYVKY